MKRAGISPTPLVPTYNSTPSRPQPHRLIHLGFPNNLEQRADAAQEREYSCTVAFSGRGSIGILRRNGERRLSNKALLERSTKLVGIEYQYKDMDGTTRFQVVQVKDEVTAPSYLVRSFDASQRLEYLSELAIRQQYARTLEREMTENVSRRVAKGLTEHGKRVIESGIALLTHKYGTRRLGFFTLTCPYTDSDQIQQFNDAYPDIIRKFMQEMKREYERKSVRFNYVGVYEIQPGRFRRTGDQCLHFHFIAPACLPGGQFVFRHGEMVSLYRRVVERSVGISLCREPRVDAQLCRKSAAGYLAKYFSKSDTAGAVQGGGSAIAVLSSWYSVSRSLLRACAKSVLHLPGNIASDIYASCVRGVRHDWCRYQKLVKVLIDGVERIVGVVFRLHDSVAATLRGIVFPQVAHLV